MGFISKHKFYAVSLLIFISAFALRFFWISASFPQDDAAIKQSFSQNDTPSYIVPAYFLYEDGTFNYSYGMADKIGFSAEKLFFGPDNDTNLFKHAYDAPKSFARRLPVYSFFLQIIPATDSLSAGLYRVLLLQALFDSASCVFIFLSAFIVLKKLSLAISATAIYAFNPLAIELTGLLFTETAFIFFFSAATWAFLSFLSKDALKYLAAAAVLAALASLTRPVGLVLTGAMGLTLGLGGIFGALRQKKLKPLVRNFALASALGVTAFTPPMLWAYRNYSATGEFFYEPTQAINRVFYLSAQVLADSQKISLDDARVMAYAECVKIAQERNIDLLQRPLNQTPSVMNAAADNLLKGKARAAFLKNVKGSVFCLMPSLAPFTRMGLINADKVSGDRYTKEMGDILKQRAKSAFSAQNILGIAYAAAYFAATAFCLGGAFLFLILCALRKIAFTWMYFFLWVMALVQILAAGAAGGARFGLTIIPSLAIFALAATACLANGFIRRFKKS